MVEIWPTVLGRNGGGCGFDRRRDGHGLGLGSVSVSATSNPLLHPPSTVSLESIAESVGKFIKSMLK